jgi:putative transposase
MSTAQMWEAEPPAKRLVAIGAYCLMPNHFHLYVTPLVEGGVSKFMQRVLTAYTMFFNERHKRSGVLFQGAFKAEHAETDRYARYLFSYIHLNPAKLRDPQWRELGVRDLRAMREYLHSYPYSSMKEYLTQKHVLTQPEYFPKYLNTRRDILDHLDDWLLNNVANGRPNLPQKSARL